MRIKRLKNNEYVLSEGVWIRNPMREGRPVDINSMALAEAQMLLKNESENLRRPHMQLDDMSEITMENVVVASDGYGWREKQLALAGLPNSSVKVLGVNGSLAKWSMVGDEAPVKRTMTFYVANNPYSECMSYLPKAHRYYPNLIASTRTNPKFLKEYRSEPYLYRPTPDLDYCGFSAGEINRMLDDYRNPICAAVSLAVRMGAKKILLLCCDESFEGERPGAERMPNGLFQYPQQVKCQKIIDRQLFWASSNGIEVADCSSGIEMKNAKYINIEGIQSFFSKEGNE
jgi:hypothetical protein